jgi:hypothetical protein
MKSRGTRKAHKKRGKYKQMALHNPIFDVPVFFKHSTSKNVG